MTVRMKQRRGTAALWTSTNPTLLEGQLGVETDTLRFKIGNGVTAWTSLAYAADTSGGLATHIADTTAAHAASAISFTPAGTIAGTDVQTAIAEVATDAAAAYATAAAIASAISTHESDTTNVHGITNTANLANEYFCIAIGDETTAITTGTAKVTFRMPFALTVTAVRASLTTASSSGIPTFDINEGAGAGTSILSTKLTIDANELTSTTAATAAVISDTALADDAQITIDVDVAGTGAAGAKIWIFGTRTV